MDSGLPERVAAIEARIASACRAAGRERSEVTLIAVSKEQPESLVAAAHGLGLRDFGENKVQPYLGRVALGLPGARWHLIGPVQTNKAKDLARHPPALLHTVDRPSLVTALENACAKAGVVLPCLVQVNIDAEDTKAGVAPGELEALLDALAAAPHLALRGLMAIPRPLEDVGEIALGQSFEAMARLLEQVRARIPAEARPILSLGMSDDFELAIAHGATHIRVGTALFGARPPHA